MTAVAAAEVTLDDLAPDWNPAAYHRPGSGHDRPHALRHRFAEGVYA